MNIKSNGNYDTDLNFKTKSKVLVNPEDIFIEIKLQVPMWKSQIYV